MVQIVEIMGRSKQGNTQPFICKGDDEKVYFVKGMGAGRRSQVCEWIAGNLALQCSLPVAPFCLVVVPEELVGDQLSYKDLGAGLAFGSVRQISTELNYAGIESIPDDIQRAVLAFDWWVRNEDRTLSESGGNPNLLWSPDREELIVIDHNQAFDPKFAVEEFLNYHVFSMVSHSLFNDVLYRDEFAALFQSVLNSWQAICDTIPEEWFYADAEMTVSADFSLDAIFNILERCTQDNFWNE